ncbi:hypothetical protein RRG08_027761 [Elysia crispata]|uniref:Uncharacterized protein n=1 Tax=Elysia crispata TaxID=231223 RepID=A0AAE1DCP5_9GAST|nr:hypothetical protein RRG08_027761 [Elysia crispata]
MPQPSSESTPSRRSYPRACLWCCHLCLSSLYIYNDPHRGRILCGLESGARRDPLSQGNSWLDTYWRPLGQGKDWGCHGYYEFVKAATLSRISAGAMPRHYADLTASIN